MKDLWTEINDAMFGHEVENGKAVVYANVIGEILERHSRPQSQVRRSAEVEEALAGARAILAANGDGERDAAHDAHADKVAAALVAQLEAAPSTVPPEQSDEATRMSADELAIELHRKTLPNGLISISDTVAVIQKAMGIAANSAYEDASDICYDHSCEGHICDCRGHISGAIRERIR